MHNHHSNAHAFNEALCNIYSITPHAVDVHLKAHR